MTAQFPTNVWDGTTPTRSAESTKVHKSPDARDFDQLREEIQAIQELLKQLKLANIALSSIKIYVGDGVDSSAGDVQATFTGAVVGERIIAVIGQVKAETAANSFAKLLPGTDVEAAVSVTNKIVFLSGLADKSASTYFAVCAPALTAIA